MPPLHERNASSSCGPVYSLRPAKPLPVLDLSKSLRGQLLPPKAHTAIHHFLVKYHRPFLLASLTALCLNNIVTLVDAATGQVISLVSVILWLPMGLGAPSTARYDVLRLLVGTFDFWFFSCTTTLTAVMVSVHFWDWRFLRMVIDWIGFHVVVCIDAQVRGIRHFTVATMAGIPPLVLLLGWTMLGHLDGCTDFFLLKHETKHGSFHLSGVDVIGNGLVTLLFLITKIAVKKRQTLQRGQKSSLVECVIYRCRLKLEILEGPAMAATSRTRTGQVPVARRLAVATIGANEATSLEPRLIQRMKFIKISQTFAANDTVFPWRVTENCRCSVWFLLPLYVIGAVGLILSSAVLVNGFNDVEYEWLLAQSWIAVLCSLAFVAPFVALYQRQLLKSVVTSFDFLFYAFQTTSANLCVCILYNWDTSRCLMVLSWGIWTQWALTLDALTPVMRERLGVRIRLAAPVVVLFLMGHIAVMCHIFFVGDVRLQDAIVIEGTIWDRHLIVRAIPFYFSRVATLSLWCPRLIWRLITASDTEVIILRGSVCYDNYFAKRGRRRSRAVTAKNILEKRHGKTYRRDQVAPAVNCDGPTALIAIQPH